MPETIETHKRTLIKVRAYCSFLYVVISPFAFQIYCISVGLVLTVIGPVSTVDCVVLERGTMCLYSDSGVPCRVRMSPTLCPGKGDNLKMIMKRIEKQLHDLDSEQREFLSITSGLG